MRRRRVCTYGELSGQRCRATATQRVRWAGVPGGEDRCDEHAAALVALLEARGRTGIKRSAVPA